MSEITRRGFLGFLASLPALSLAFTSDHVPAALEPIAAVPSGIMTVAQAQQIVANLIDEVWGGSLEDA